LMRYEQQEERAGVLPAKGRRFAMGNDSVRRPLRLNEEIPMQYCNNEIVLYLGQKVLCFEPECSDNNNEEQE